jgi:ABC-type lipoprotein export system ATPase subunit
MTDPESLIVNGTKVSRSFERGSERIGAMVEASFSVRAGDRIAVMGASGSGKSTLLHLMAGLLEPSSGSLTWPSLATSDAAGSGGIAIAFQAPSLVPWFDALENVMTPLLLRGIDPATARHRARGALAALGLDELTAKLPEELSAGQAQRVAIARALAQDAALILADEPTGQLDQETAHAVVASLLEAASREQAALVVATHDPRVAAELPTIWQMEHGRLTLGETVP